MRKSKAQKTHFRNRVNERFGLNLRQEEIVMAIHASCHGKVHNGIKARFIRKRTNRITLWEIEMNGLTMTVVYDKIRKNLVTAF